MRRGRVRWTCLAISVASAAGCTGSLNGGRVATFNWPEGPAPNVADRSPAALACVRATAKRISGPYRSYPMALAWPCAVEFAVAAGSIPNHEAAIRVRVGFCQGDKLARLLRQSRELILIFDQDGRLVDAAPARPESPVPPAPPPLLIPRSLDPFATQSLAPFSILCYNS